MSTKFYPLLVRFSKYHRDHLQKRSAAVGCSEAELIRILVEVDEMKRKNKK